MKDTTDDTARELTRRALLKRAFTGLLAGAAAPALLALTPARAAGPGGGRGALVVFFSRSGNTREVAGQVHGVVGGDLVEIRTRDPYPADYRETTTKAKQELESGYRPPITTRIADIRAYDVVLLGSPNWWGTVATPVMTFLSEHDLSGKTIAPFVTHGGSALGRSLADIGALCPGAVVTEGLAVRGTDARNARGDVADWLQRIGIKARSAG